MASYPALEDWFSTAIRRNRKSFMIASVALFAVLAVVYFVISWFTPPRQDGNYTWSFVLVFAPFAIAYIIGAYLLTAQRLRDIGLTGWLTLLWIPVSMADTYLHGAATLAAWIVLFTVPGTQGPNRYGPDPVGSEGAAVDGSDISGFDFSGMDFHPETPPELSVPPEPTSQNGPTTSPGGGAPNLDQDETRPDGGEESEHSAQSHHHVLPCPICGKKLRMPAGKRGTIICPKCRTSLLANTVIGSLKPKSASSNGEANPQQGTAEQNETRSNDDEQAEKRKTDSAEEMPLRFPSMPAIASGTLIDRWKAGEFDLLLVSKPKAVIEAFGGYKGPSSISYELTLAVMRDTPQWPAVMFISIERSSGVLSGLASGTLCLGVFNHHGHLNLGSVDTLNQDEFMSRATAIFREHFGFTGEMVHLDDETSQ